MTGSRQQSPGTSLSRLQLDDNCDERQQNDAQPPTAPTESPSAPTDQLRNQLDPPGSAALAGDSYMTEVFERITTPTFTRVKAGSMHGNASFSRHDAEHFRYGAFYLQPNSWRRRRVDRSLRDILEHHPPSTERFADRSQHALARSLNAAQKDMTLSVATSSTAWTWSRQAHNDASRMPSFLVSSIEQVTWIDYP